jgi:hypothetical protein
MQEYNADLVTGLLQTEVYARAVMAARCAPTATMTSNVRSGCGWNGKKRLTAQDAPPCGR